MSEESASESVAAVMRRINQAWLDGRVDDLRPMLHPEMVMVFPGFQGRAHGREALLDGFRDFCQNAKIHEFHDRGYEIDEAHDTAVVTFPYDMIYERDGKKYKASGRDLWVFQRQGDTWIAVWRTMLDVAQHEV